MTSFQSQPANVEAEQWDGSADALLKIQQLIFPASPLVGRKENHADPERQRLGVMVDTAGLMKHELVHLNIGDWVVVWPGGAIKVVGEKEFGEMFRPAAGFIADAERANTTDRPSLADA